AETAPFPTLDRAERNAQPPGDGALAQVVVVRELDHRSLALGQPRQRSVEPERIDVDRLDHTGRRLVPDRDRWPASALEVQGRPPSKRQEPGGHAPAARVEERRLAPDASEDLLL